MNSHFAVYPSDNIMVKLCFTEMPVALCQRDCSCFAVVCIFTVNLLCFSDAMAPDSVSLLLLWSGGEFPETDATVDSWCLSKSTTHMDYVEFFLKCTFWLMCCAESDDFTHLPFTRQTTWWWEPWELKISDNWSLCWPLCCQVLPLNCPHQIEQVFVLPGVVMAQPLGTFECWLHETPRR